MGIALGAVSVRVGHWLAKNAGIDGLPAADYRLAFLLVGLVSLTGLFDSLKLDSVAGGNVIKEHAAMATTALPVKKN